MVKETVTLPSGSCLFSASSRCCSSLPRVPCLGLKNCEKFEIHGKVWTVGRERGNAVIISYYQKYSK